MFATRSTVVAAFNDAAHARAAVAELRRAGFADGQIGWMGRDAGAEETIPLALTAWGLSPDEARHYEEHFRTGRSVVVVDAGDRAGEAHAIMHHHDPRDDSFAGIGIFGTDLPATPY